MPLALPEKLTLSSIEHTPTSLRITAVERREGALREPELDKREEVEDSEIIYKAYIYKIVRGFTAFEWDLTSNQAFLQVTQLPSGQRYDEAATRFFELVAGILRTDDFTQIDLRHVIKRLHELEESGTPETRSHGMGYKTLQGRTLTGRSSSGSGALLGESVIDDAMASIRKVGVGHLVSPLTKLDRNSGPGYAVGVPFCTEGVSLCVVVRARPASSWASARWPPRSGIRSPDPGRRPDRSR